MSENPASIPQVSYKQGGSDYLIPCLCVIALLVFTSSCAGAPPRQDKEASKPLKRDVKWIYGPARMEGRLCAVGYCGATFYPAHAREAASDHCRAELAKSIQSRIVSLEIDWSREGFNLYIGDIYVDATMAATEAVIGNMELVDYFFDREGQYSSDGSTMTYVLCCVPEDVLNDLRKISH